MSEGAIKMLRYWDISDWAGNIDTRRSTTGYVFVLGGAAVCCAVIHGTEYMAVTDAASEAI